MKVLRLHTRLREPFILMSYMGIKRRLFILGASSFARELESWLSLLPESDQDWELQGFLHTSRDDSPLSGYPTRLRVLGSWEDFPLQHDDYVAVGISDPEWKERIWLNLRHKVQFFTFVAHNATIGAFTNIGPGSVICPGVVISTNVNLGVAVTVNSSTNIGHDAALSDFSSVMGNVVLAGGVELGEGAYVGAGTTVIPDKKIGAGARLGAGSIVIQNVADRESVFGNPARRVGA